MRSLPIVLAGILVGLTMGVGLYSFVYARGYAYVRSPLLNVNRGCQTSHRWPEQELKDRVEKIRTHFFDTRNIALNALLDLIHDIGMPRRPARQTRNSLTLGICSAKPSSTSTSWSRRIRGISRRSVLGEIVGGGDQLLPRRSISFEEEGERSR